MKPIKVRGEGVGLKCRTAAAAECGCMGSMVNQYPALLCGLPPALPASGPTACPMSPTALTLGTGLGVSALTSMDPAWWGSKVMLGQSRGRAAPHCPFVHCRMVLGLITSWVPNSSTRVGLEAMLHPTNVCPAGGSILQAITIAYSGVARRGDTDTKGSIRNDGLIGGR